MVLLFPVGAVLVEQVTETFNEILNFGASQEALILRSDQKMMQVKPLIPGICGPKEQVASVHDQFVTQ